MTDSATRQRPFLKMHGLGNDFVVFDARQEPLALTPALARALADRRRGIGCDQIVVLRPAEEADVHMDIHNADGGPVAACGNATRCIARLLMSETGRADVQIETDAGMLAATGTGTGIAVSMGPPGLDWRDIPLAEAVDTDHLPVEAGPFRDPAAISMGNPHLIFFSDGRPDWDAFRAAAPDLEHHPLFPQRANVTLAHATAADALTILVWERGAGLTQACGTAACAALVAAHRRGLTGPKARVTLPGGDLVVQWDKPADTVVMAGPAALSYYGAVDLSLYETEEAA